MAVEIREGRRKGSGAGIASPAPMKRTNSLKNKLSVAVENKEKEKEKERERLQQTPEKADTKRAGSLQRAGSQGTLQSTPMHSPSASRRLARTASLTSPSTPGRKTNPNSLLSPTTPSTPSSDKKRPLKSPSAKGCKSPKVGTTTTTTTAPTVALILKLAKSVFAEEGETEAVYIGLKMLADAAKVTSTKRVSKPPPKKQSAGGSGAKSSPRKVVSPRKGRKRAAKEQHPKMMAFKEKSDPPLDLDANLEGESEGSDAAGEKLADGACEAAAVPEGPVLKSCMSPFSLVPKGCPTTTLPSQHIHVAKILENSCTKSPHALARYVYWEFSKVVSIFFVLLICFSTYLPSPPCKGNRR